MNNPKTPSPLRSADYEAIEAALLESLRGRWFLAEYAKRNRTADTRMLLDAISRIETTLLQPRTGSRNETFKRDLIEMSEAISRTRSEIPAMRSPDDADSRFSVATEELGAIVEATEKATSEILSAAEEIQEIAWQMRERGADTDACDRLDAHATGIYTACSFQDLTGQRTGKVVETLRFLEKRMLTMIDIWGIEDDNLEVREHTQDAGRPDSHLLNGPARQGDGVGQEKIDEMMESGPEPYSGEGRDASTALAPPAPETAAGPAPGLDGEIDVADFAPPPELDVETLDDEKTKALFN